MIRKILTAVFAAALLVLAGCKQDADNTTLAPYLYDYAPKDVGHSVIYDVDSISYIYDASGSGQLQVYDTTFYQLKDVILDSANSVCQLGTICYSVAEYKRYDTTQPWPANYQAWYFFTTRNTYETVQNDLHFVKLVFPPIVGVNWQGNEYIATNDTIDVQNPFANYAGWTYTYTSVNKPATINGHTLDSTTVVSEVNTEQTNAIQGVLSTETYARHIGLVYRQFEVINKQDPTSSYTLPNQANGFRVLQWYHSYTP